MNSSAKFKNLLGPVRIGEMELRNRIVMPAMGIGLARDGHVTEQMKDYYEERAKGGVGLVITESTAVHTTGISGVGSVRSDDDRFIPGLSELAQTIQKHGAKAALQLHHTGPAGRSSILGSQPVAASATSIPADREATFELPRELTVSEIAELVACFANAAERAKRAGFDAVEIHGAHRYLINSFLSPALNKRQDDYGGDLRNRARFLLEIIKAIRESIGQAYPVLCKISAREFYLEDGITLEQTKEVAQMIQEAGVDAIDLSAMPMSPPFLIPGSRIFLAEAVKKVVSIPVISLGRITPEVGEKSIRQKKTDLIAIGRALIADPELPNKVASGRLQDIRACVGCETCRKHLVATEGKVRIHPSLICTVNPAAGRERESRIQPADKPRRVFVVGGGPGGMEAARVAALRGHHVVLYEKDHRLGGSLTLAGLININYEKLNKYLTSQIRKLGIKVEFGKEVTPALIDKLKPDVLILAMGSIPLLPKIRGIDSGIVVSAANIRAMMSGRLKKGTRMTWRRVLWYLGSVILRMPIGLTVIRRLLRLGMPFGKKVIVIGNALPGCEMADFLAETGKKVTLIELPESITAGVMPKPMDTLRQFFLDRLVQKGATVLTGVKYEQITNKGLVITNKEGKREAIEANTIVVTTGAVPNTELLEALRGKVPEIHLIGDSADPRGILEAIHDGYEIAREI